MKKGIGVSILLFALAGTLAAITWINVLWAKNIIVVSSIIVIIWALYLIVGPFKKPLHVNIQRLVLINGDGERDKEWVVAEATSLLIGKSSHFHYVDVDLADNRYEAFVAASHAVLNRIDEDWYIEELETVNGVGIKKNGQSYNYRIQPKRPYKIDVGDIIYIAKIRLLAK